MDKNEKTGMKELIENTEKIVTLLRHSPYEIKAVIRESLKIPEKTKDNNVWNTPLEITQKNCMGICAIEGCGCTYTRFFKQEHNGVLMYVGYCEEHAFPDGTIVADVKDVANRTEQKRKEYLSGRFKG